MSFLSPVTPEVLAELTPAAAAELKTWSTNHSNLFDLRLHSLKTCPFLIYIPNYITSRRNIPEWSRFLHWFFKNKHLEENHCKC